MKKILLTCLTLLSAFASLRATHILGGYMTCTNQGSGIYTVKLILYRDCYSQTPFDGTPGSTTDAIIGVFDNNNTLVQSVNLVNPVITNIDSFDNPYCIIPNVCVEKGVYQANLSLPGNFINYTLVYERCCLAYTINNVIDPGNVGSVIMSHAIADNSSPTVNFVLPVVVAINQPFSLSNWCTGTDGDSLSYSLMTPLIAANAGTPAPNPPYGPPYDTLLWVNGYNANAPLDSNSAFFINDTTGTIGGTPVTIGSFMVGVKVTEHRNGHVLAEYPLSFTLNVTYCNYHPDTTTGVVNVKEQGLNVYPNPFTNQLTIEGLPDGSSQLSVFDLTGKVVVPLQQVNSSKATLNWPAGVSAGAYILQVNNNLRQLVIKQ